MARAYQIFLAVAAVLAVAVFPSQLQQPPDFDFVDGGDGLAVMRHEVTMAAWRRCHDDGGCNFMPGPGPGALDENYPVTGVGILDVQEFVAWARKGTGQDLRLPTLEEWYRFSEVEPVRPAKIFADPKLAWAETYGDGARIDPTLRAGGGFGVNGKGIADVTGNVWEWTSSCVFAAAKPGHCPAYYAAGAHEARIAVFVRDPQAGGCAIGTPPAHLGFRLVKGFADRMKDLRAGWLAAGAER